MNGVVDGKVLIDNKKLTEIDQTIDVDLDITNVKTMEIWLHSGQSNDGKAIQGMLADPTFIDKVNAGICQNRDCSTSFEITIKW